ncbi:16S rRNA (uracil(1498)-N(3))-methyltransferase [Flectobacillus major]|jgi:16S rRNA (uracil1498-N3)-methyltransferase|uniref:16S rRNA (uracil(1498)-N(3))-methyltransferase n=1 Tax=Flectobacillus major TaxID=103 RepID=UPI000425C29A|nr:16S rRNA (uracil(1498)-N(3))-methyltransferase [Flectobacillus major]
MNLFYQPEIQSQQRLNEEESRHAVKVLRLQEGELIHVIDGKGGLFKCSILKAHDKKCELNILEYQSNFGVRNYYFHLVIAPTKNLDRIEWMIEKCVEIGIDEITFVQTRYSERKEVKLPRIEKIAVGAMKQSLKAFMPKINEMITWKEFLKKDLLATHNLIAHLEDGERHLLKNVPLAGESTCVLIGPEGDFSNDEITQALQKGFRAVSLGDSRLRTETAGLVACHTLNLINQ